jgi:hypothetical protein
MKDFGITSECLYIWKADKLWRGKSFPANHNGVPLGNPEECLRQSNYTFIRRHDLTSEIGFLQLNRIKTYYVERNRQEFLDNCNELEVIPPVVPEAIYVS